MVQRGICDARNGQAAAIKATAAPLPEASERTPKTEPSGQGAQRSWSLLVARIAEGDQAAHEELYANLSRSARYYFCRHLGPFDLDDRLHDLYLAVVTALRAGSLREPEALMGFIRTILRRQVAAGIDVAVRARRNIAESEAVVIQLVDKGPTPEGRAMDREKARLMRQLLQEASHRDREILTRFYLQQQPQALICQQMELDETQFRLLKSRAKARFEALVQERLKKTVGQEGRRVSAAA